MHANSQIRWVDMYFTLSSHVDFDAVAILINFIHCLSFMPTSLTAGLGANLKHHCFLTDFLYCSNLQLIGQMHYCSNLQLLGQMQYNEIQSTIRAI